MKDVKFFICDHCGKIVSVVKDTPVPLMCCGQKMREIEANSVDAAVEKHTPVISIDGTAVKITVSSVAHPMLEAHFIEWVCLETEQGIQMKYLAPGQAPEASFAITAGDQVKAAYAYCNLHGLWKTLA